MPFDGIYSEAADAFPLKTTNTLALIDGLLEFYAEPGTWRATSMSRHGKHRTLLGAIRHVRRTRGITGDDLQTRISRLFQDMGVSWLTLKLFNDAARGETKIKELLKIVRQSILAETQKPPTEPAALVAYCRDYLSSAPNKYVFTVFCQCITRPHLLSTCTPNRAAFIAARERARAIFGDETIRKAFKTPR